MKINKGIVVAGLVLVTGLVACNSGNMRRNPGKTYAPDMTYSVAYDAYTQNPNFVDSQSSRLPVRGTIARGHGLPDHLVEGDTMAYRSINPELHFTEAELAEGGRLYTIYCGICHGTNLDGNGPMYNGGNGKFAAKPAELVGANLHMPPGKIYAAIKFGKNMMGSYASQLDIKQRWQVIAYIKKFQSEAGGDPFTMGIGTPSAPAAAAPADTATKPASTGASPAATTGATATAPAAAAPGH